MSIPESEPGFAHCAASMAIQGLLVTGEGWRFEFVNPAFARMFDCAPADMIGKSMEDLIYPEDQRILSEARTKWLKGETTTYEIRLVRSDGRIIYAHITGVPRWHKENVIGLIAVVTDLMEGQRTEQAIRHSEQRLADIITLFPDPILAIDKECKMTVWNNAMEELTGIQAKDMLGKGNYEYSIPFYGIRRPILADLVLRPDEQVEKTYATLQREGETIVAEAYIPSFGPRGAYFWSKASPLYDPQGCLVGAIEVIREITDRKNAEHELRESEEKYRNLVEQAKEGVIIIQDGIVRCVNPALAKMWGGSTEEILDRPFTDFVHPDAIAEVTERYRRRMAGDKVTSVYDAKLKRKDGREAYAQLNASIITFQGKNANFVIIHDITERKLAEDMLKDSENRYKAIFESTGTAMMIVEENNEISLFNAEFEKMTGYTKEEIDEKKSWLEFVVEDDLERTKIQHLLWREHPNIALKNCEIHLRKKTGQIRDILLTMNMIPGTKKSIASLLDITDRKNAEEALEAERDRAEKYLNIAEVILIVLDTHARITLLNRKGYEILGYEEGELSGKDWIKTCLRPQDHEAVHEVNRKISAGEIKAFEYYEGYVLTKKGEERFIAWHTTILKDEIGRIVGTLSSGEDITESNLAEAELKKTQSRMRLAMDLVKLVQWEYDVEADMFTFDDQFYALYGTTAEKEGGSLMHSKDYAEKFLPAGEVPLVAEEINKALATTDPNFTSQVEHRIIRADGTEGFIAVRFAVVKDDKGHTIKAYGASQDITERKRAEKELKDSESRYRAIFENTGTAMVIAEENNIISLANSEFERLSGYSKEEIEGKKSWTEFVVKEDIERMMQQHKLRRIDPSAALRSYEFKANDRNGQVKDILLHVDLIPGTKKSISSWTDITERKWAEEKIHESLTEKELLLKEIHHRVKNNLQIISTLLYLQSSNFDDENLLEILRDCQDRIKAMALIHEKLYRSDNIGKIDFEDYVRQLVSQLAQSHLIIPGRIYFDINIERAFLNIDTAIPCGMIINELISNSLKHAFPDGQEGEISVDFRVARTGIYELVIEDNGVGINEEALKDTKTLGLQLVGILIKQLDGRMKLDTTRGTKWEIRFEERTEMK